MSEDRLGFQYKQYEHWKKMPGDQDHGAITVYAHNEHGGRGCAETDVKFVLGVVMSAIEPKEYARLNLPVEAAGGADHGLASGAAAAGTASNDKGNGGAASNDKGNGGAASNDKGSGGAASNDKGNGGAASNDKAVAVQKEGGATSKKHKDNDYVRVGNFQIGDLFPHQGSHFDLTSDDDEAAVPTPAVSQPSVTGVTDSDAMAIESVPQKQTQYDRLSSTEMFAMLAAIREKMAKEGWGIAQIQQVQNRPKASSHQFWAHTNGFQNTPTVRVFHGTGERSVPSIVTQGLMLTKMANTAFGSGIYSSNDFQTARDYASQRQHNYSKLLHIMVLDLHTGLVQALTTSERHYDFERVPGTQKYYNSRYVPWKHYYVAKEEAQLHLHAVLVVRQLEVVAVETEETKEAARAHAAGAPARAAAVAQQHAVAQEHYKQQLAAAEAKREQHRKDMLMSKNKLKKEKKEATVLAKQSPIPENLQNLDNFYVGKTVIHRGDTVSLMNLPAIHEKLEGALCIVRYIIREPQTLLGKWVVFVEPYDKKHHPLILKQNLLNEKKNKGTGYSRYGGEGLERFLMVSTNKVKRDDKETRFDCQHSKGKKRRAAAMELVFRAESAYAARRAIVGGGEGAIQPPLSKASGKAPKAAESSEEDMVPPPDPDSD